MAGSRVERFGSIYSRMKGLIRSGAVKDSEKPIWYEVYEAFPPRVQPLQDPPGSVKNILYREDVIRAQFYKTFGNPDVVDLTNEVTTTCQRFVEQFSRLQSESGGTGEVDEVLFDKTTDLLRARGIRLRSLEQIRQEREANVAGGMRDTAVATSDDTNKLSVLNQLMDEMERERSDGVVRSREGIDDGRIDRDT